MKIVAFPEAGTPPALRGQVVALQHHAWPPADGAAVPDSPLTHDAALYPGEIDRLW